MAAKEKEEGEEGQEAAPKKKGKKKLIIIIIVLLLVGGGAGFFLMGGEKPKEDEAEHEEIPVLKLAKLDPFIVNLADDNRFLKVSMYLEYDANIIEKAIKEQAGHASGGHGSGGGEAAADSLPALLQHRLPMLRDAVIRVLTIKKVQEIQTTEGKESLKQELIEAINEASGLSEGPVVNVHFTEFIIQ